jgi:hypothetical protein
MKLILRHTGKDGQKKSTIGKLNVKYIEKIEFYEKKFSLLFPEFNVKFTKEK